MWPHQNVTGMRVAVDLNTHLRRSRGKNNGCASLTKPHLNVIALIQLITVSITSRALNPHSSICFLSVILESRDVKLILKIAHLHPPASLNIFHDHDPLGTRDFAVNFWHVYLVLQFGCVRQEIGALLRVGGFIEEIGF